MVELEKYAIEVLSAYAASLTLLGGLIWMTLHRGKRARRELQRAEEETRRDA